MTWSCKYRHQKWTGEWVLKRMQCKHGCCGSLNNQRCCEGADAHVWQITTAVACGLLVLCVLFIIILCAVKKNNLARSRTADTTSRASYFARRDTFAAVEGSASPPPYSARECNIFLIGNNMEQTQEQRPSTLSGNCLAGVACHPHDHENCETSSIKRTLTSGSHASATMYEKRKSTRNDMRQDQGPPVYTSNPPYYSG